VAAALEAGGIDAARTLLAQDYQLALPAADQLTQYLAAAHAALGALPTQDHLILERFLDEVGDPHLVIHSPFGARINRAFGLALRKRFCRQFNFELQAAALEDSLLLSLGPTHRFDLLDVPRYLHSRTVRAVLVQALLDAPFFPARWRWVATTALTVPRRQGGRRRPPQFQRQDAEDLIALIFPDQLACLENIRGEREIPDHPLVQQTLRDSLDEVMDGAGLERLLQGLESGAVRVSGRDLTAPSPLAEAVINAKPYAFLDDGAAEERRTRAIATRSAAWTEAAAPTLCDEAVVAAVQAQLRPPPRDAEELLDALEVCGFLDAHEGAACHPEAATWFAALCAAGRAHALSRGSDAPLWVARERLAEVQSACQASGGSSACATALQRVLRDRLASQAPSTATVLAAPLGVAVAAVEAALEALAAQGEVMAGSFTAAGVAQWCERRVLARLQRASLQRRRAQQDTVGAADFQRFLLHWHGLDAPPQGPDALCAALDRLAGWSAPAPAWEGELLSARIKGFAPADLDALLSQGRYLWLRLALPEAGEAGDRPRFRGSSLRQIPLTLIPRGQWRAWRAVAPLPDPGTIPLSGAAQSLLAALENGGALFHEELIAESGLLPSHVDTALTELIGWGLATADGFAAFRRPRRSMRRGDFGRARRAAHASPLAQAGRWSRLRPLAAAADTRARFPTHALDTLETVARTLLRRYGVVFKALLAREGPLPPWRELLYVFWRLEAQGEVLGGRFVAGFSGEQFALPEAVGLLRTLARQAASGAEISLSAADPLNLAGILTPGERIPALPGRRVLYRNGADAIGV